MLLKKILFFILLPFLGQGVFTPQDPIEDFVANYFAALNNLGDAALSLEDRRYFRSDLLATYFLKETIVYNDLRPTGTQRIRAREYLNNVLIDFPKGVVFRHQVLEKGAIQPTSDGFESTIHLRVTLSIPGQRSRSNELVMALQITDLSTSRLVARIKSMELASEIIENRRDLPAPIQELERNMVRVQGGTFRMGCTAEQGDDCYDREKPDHRVTLSSYSIGKYEVTQAQWAAVMGNNPSSHDNCANCPVERVSWEDAQVFLRKLNEMTDKSYRLPTEVEWEYAARGGNQSRGYKYAGSNSVGTVAWYRENSGSETHEVGSKSSNELGLYDMSGNVWEWCSDWYGDYSGNAQRNPQGPDSGAIRVIRGGSWGANAGGCRVSFRYYGSPGYRGYILGFRLAAP